MTLLKQNKPVLDLCGIPAWWDAGYTGKNGLTVTHEHFNPALSPLEGMATDGTDDTASDSPHGFDTAMYHRLVLPERKIVMLPSGYSVSYDANNKPTFGGKLIETTIPYMLKNKPDVVFWSQYSFSNKEKIPQYAPIGEFCSMFACAANSGDSNYNRYIDLDYWFGVGAVSYKAGNVTTEYYTSWDGDVDFAGFADLYIPTQDGKGINAFDGTSPATPYVAAEAGLVNELMLSKTGKALPSTLMYAYLKAHTVDVDSVGKDVRTGYGYIKLPAPKTAENELFHLTKQADKLYAQEKAAGSIRHTAQYFIDLVKSGRA